jgi:hypothetical protein
VNGCAKQGEETAASRHFQFLIIFFAIFVGFINDFVHTHTGKQIVFTLLITHNSFRGFRGKF